MTPKTPRKFTILDGMILVAALAGGFALRRAAQEAFEERAFPHNYENRIGLVVRKAIEVEFPFLVTLTPAALVIRLRRPRPRWRRLARQPGMAACCATVFPIVMSLNGLREFAGAWPFPCRSTATVTASGSPSSSRSPPWGCSSGTTTSPSACGSRGRLVLALTGRRRPEKSWIDRMGRIVGIGWLSIPVTRALAFLSG
jgi:hypothetical protein